MTLEYCFYAPCCVRKLLANGQVTPPGVGVSSGRCTNCISTASCECRLLSLLGRPALFGKPSSAGFNHTLYPLRGQEFGFPAFTVLSWVSLVIYHCLYWGDLSPCCEISEDTHCKWEAVILTLIRNTLVGATFNWWAHVLGHVSLSTSQRDGLADACFHSVQVVPCRKTGVNTTCSAGAGFNSDTTCGWRDSSELFDLNFPAYCVCENTCNTKQAARAGPSSVTLKGGRRGLRYVGTLR
jgi:hypothetical protein